MKLLIADDSSFQRQLLRSILSGPEYELIEAVDGLEALRALQQPDAPHVAILDWNMPGMDGVDVCRRVRADDTGAYKYLILLTSQDSRESVIAGLEAGADDYIKKPCDAGELEQRLRAGIRIVELQNRLLATQEILRRQATHDPLTGILNRGAIIDLLKRTIERASRDQKPVAVLLGDVDHFKRLNDTYGHLAGDEALREVTQRIAKAVRPHDLVGRYGGEEFLVVLNETNRLDALVVADRIRTRICETPFAINGASVTVTMSLGLSVTRGLIDAKPDHLIQYADEALYEAKDAGRNCIRYESAETIAV